MYQSHSEVVLFHGLTLIIRPSFFFSFIYIYIYLADVLKSLNTPKCTHIYPQTKKPQNCLHAQKVEKHASVLERQLQDNYTAVN